MDKDIKWDQRFGNMFGGFLGVSFIFVVIVFFYEGCSWEGYDRNDKIVNPEKEEGADPNVDFTASDWILFK